ncbi:MAG: repeat protein [Myxococcaceae bacterium]|nr:repeat protein [Myxococcaceae bacterium]
MSPMKKTFSMFLAAGLACATMMSGTDAKSDGETNGGGTAAIYKNIPPDQIEFLSTNERIVSVSSSGSPSAIWEALEHGERVECLACIPAVAPLLYDTNAKNREIAAWWLRRRVFGVFGPGEVYETTLATLKNDPNPTRRAYAANALGEFLLAPGIAACAEALSKDSDADVRVAAAAALGRLNDEGGGSLARALGDGEPKVRLAALKSVGHVNGFSDVASVARLTGDGDAQVRRRAVEVLDGLYAKDSVASVLALAKSDPDADVRIAACHALMTFGDGSARATLESIAKDDKNGLVRDMAAIALRRV